MGCPIDEVKKNGDSVTVWAEGYSITFVMAGNKLKYTAFSNGYFQAFRFRPKAMIEHESAAMKALNEPVEKTGKQKAKKKKSKRKKKEIIDPCELNRNPYHVNPMDFPVGENGEYVGLPIAVIYNSISVLYRKKKGEGLPVEYKEIITEALEDLGFTGKNLGSVRSAIAKEMWRRRKAKRAALEKKKLEEAREAETNHRLPLEA